MIKEIWCMPHSHLDVGYTHPQPLLMKLQSDYLDQAIDLCVKTADYPEEARFCWTVEANIVVKEWLKTAPSERVKVLKRLIQEGRICITALPMHTTPNCDTAELITMLSGLNSLADELETQIHVAINHDVNGQPWTLGQLLLDSGIDFYLTGINIHFGGIPFPRPSAFDWEMADGRRLLTFLGEHYSLFSQFLFTEEHSTKRMEEGAKEYVSRLEAAGYTKDFVFLTATNPPLYDNNCPDLELAELIRSYNAEGHEQKIRLVTAEMLREKLLSEGKEERAVYRGDWTDYWNFGSGSTARETRVSRLAKQTLKQAELLECMHGSAGLRYQAAKQESQENSLVFDEHTWGASQSVTEPDSPETYSQLLHKLEPAYRAADLAGYCLSTQIEACCGNPHQSNQLEGMLFVNTSGTEQEVEVRIPEGYQTQGRQLAALRSKNYVPYLKGQEPKVCQGLLKLPAYTAKCLSWENLAQAVGGKEKARQYHRSGNTIETPYYRISLEPETGRIYGLFDKQMNRELLDASQGYSLFEPVRETIDPKEPANRATLFPRNVDLGNQSISQWNHDWKRRLQKAEQTGRWKLIEEDYRILLSYELSLPGTSKLEQTFYFYTYSPGIRMEVSLKKEPVYEPESIFFAVPVLLQEGWNCCYDTAGEQVFLDEEQLGAVCRDWLTVDTGISLFQEGICITLSCPDAPLVQVGEFRFGKESKRIEREKNPLLLAWALNNYWDTNFHANQSGQMEFAYELNIHDYFDPKNMLADGLHAQRPVVTGAVVSIEAAEAEGFGQTNGLLEGEGESMILYLYPASEGSDQAVQAVLKNPTEKEDNFCLKVWGFEPAGASLVTPQGKSYKSLEVQGAQVIVPVPPRGIRIVRLEKKEQK